MFRPEIGRVVLVPNPSAIADGLAEHTKEQIQTSKRFKRDVIILPTLPGGLKPNAEQFHNTLEKGDAIGALCGDGSFWFIAAGLIVAELAEGVPVASLGGGNARDIGRATQRRRGVAADTFFARAQAVPSYMLRADITTPNNNSETFFAASYMGWGKTALGAAMVDTDEYRNGHWPRRDWHVGTTTLNRHETFEMVGDNEVLQTLGDLTIAKSSSIAKIGHPPVDPWNKLMWVSPTRPGKARAWTAFGGLALGSALDAFGWHQDGPYCFELATPTPYHYDGETRRTGEAGPIILPVGTEVVAGLESNPYLLLTDVRCAA